MGFALIIFFYFSSPHKYFGSFEPSGTKQLTAHCSNIRNPQGARLYILKADKIVQPCRQQTFSQLLVEQGEERGKKKRNIVNYFKKHRYLEFIVDVLI